MSLMLKRIVRRCQPLLTALPVMLLLTACASNSVNYEQARAASAGGDFAAARQGYERYLAGGGDEYESSAARLELARIYLLGLGVAPDPARAASLLAMLAGSDGDAWRKEASHLLAELYLRGQGVGKDSVRAVALYQQAAYPRAVVDLAMLYWEGKDVPQDRAQAAQLIAALDLPDNLTGLMLHRGLHDVCGEGRESVLAWHPGGCLDDEDAALIEMAESRWQRERGQSPATVMAFIAHLYNATVSREADNRFGWYEWSGQRGDPLSQRVLGFTYANGAGVAQDTDKALFWFEQAARQGDPVAAFALGRMLQHGSAGQPADLAAAMEWYEKAAGAGQTDAMIILADLYLDPPEGHSRNVDEAIRLLRSGMAQGDNRATHRLADVYFSPEHGRADKEAEAIGMYERLAEESDLQAAFHLGMIYATGRGTIGKSPTLAIRWLEYAARKDHLYAQNALADLYDVYDRPDSAAQWRDQIVSRDLAHAPARERTLVAAVQYKQAMYYYKSGEAKRDLGKAVQLLTLAAEADAPAAQAFLGLLYYEGGELPRDPDLAYKWLSRWSEQRDEALARASESDSVYDRILVESHFANERAQKALLELLISRRSR